MLYLVSTPIGNLADITLRALEILKECDTILCEDTRHSRILLSHYQIHRPLKSYHQFNEAKTIPSILSDLKNGKKLALISDAGTPGISDPGEKLVSVCLENDLLVTALPGPCALIQALICSGLSTTPFQFVGFLPRKEAELKRELLSILSYSGTTICYESPKRLLEVLSRIHQMDATRKLVIARELTKKFEEIVRGTADTLLQHWSERELKGEVVLLVSGSFEKKDESWLELSPQKHVQLIEETYGVSRQEAIKIVAELRGVPKRQIYQQVMKKD